MRSGRCCRPASLPSSSNELLTGPPSPKPGGRCSSPQLSRDDFPVPAQRVVIGKPIPIGRTGGEAAIISLNQVGAVLSGTGFRTDVGRGRSLGI